MTRLILQPASNKGAREHYRDTVSSAVDLTSIKALLSPDEAVAIEQNYPDQKVFCWGVTPSDKNRRNWEKISRGDVTLFAKSGKLFAKATTTFKSRNRQLATQLWGVNEKGETWEYMYFLNEVQELSIPYPEFNAVIGYKPNFVIQGFMVLDEVKAAPVLSAFDMWSPTFFPEVTKQELSSVLQSMEETEREAVVKTRKEQAFLRNALFGSSVVSDCACCGDTFPISMLVTAHLKPRSKCSREERLDTNVVLPMCKFGCDELYEKGFLIVDASGKLEARGNGTTPVVQSRLRDLHGRAVKGYSRANAAYFAWHKGHHDPEG